MLNKPQTRRATAAAALAFASLLGLPTDLSAQRDPSNAVTFALSIENDVFSGTDRNYTNGTKLSWDFAEAGTYRDIEQLPGWVQLLASKKPSTLEDSIGFGATLSVGQNIYTPKNKEATELIRDDRPYAGWTYLSLALRERRGLTTDTLELTLGLVGPDSYAEDIQNWIHEKIGSTIANGWDNQLKNEFGGIVAWRRDSELFRIPESQTGWGADLNSSFGLAAGTIQSYVHAGGNLRFGYNRGAPAAPPRIRPGVTSPFPASENDPRLNRDLNRSGFFLTFGAEGRYVAQNIFIEGNTWADSHGLEEHEYVSDVYGGATLIAGDWTFSYVYTIRSEEFVGQEDPHEFGGITIARTF
ncbi:lipid A deacylase LpxR family protein [Pelagicoccus sp. SDUM812003]|uniref:lipid A deacylase LpxR family protein n=1 Tax=Pelagicoccus sp. SDUM812003 TaxID=3041267 RepID=UPI00280D1000|nr:lipid A deacylase LpxR family protein [Pelagicoccus sp. SDUM812003]MDQ8204109.1 lipid A deacylase LpxR family protein [Pelagicoccus sp. SDUM812003]